MLLPPRHRTDCYGSSRERSFSSVVQSRKLKIEMGFDSKQVTERIEWYISSLYDFIKRFELLSILGSWKCTARKGGGCPIVKCYSDSNVPQKSYLDVSVGGEGNVTCKFLLIDTPVTYVPIYASSPRHCHGEVS